MASLDVKSDLHGVYLGYPFDQLLDQSCPYLVKERRQHRPEDPQDIHDEGRRRRGLGTPGIVLPGCDRPGTGNIVICGPPGSAKSTLALQFAVACTRPWNMGGVPALISLENTPEEILAKARPFGWEPLVRVMHHLHDADEFATSEQLARTLLHVITQPGDRDCPARGAHVTDDHVCAGHRDQCTSRLLTCKMEKHGQGLILLASLSPRPLAGQEPREDIFWTRYRQIERLLAAGAALRRDLGHDAAKGALRRILPLVVIDSLNMMAARELTRDEMATLFGLFRHYGTVGIFVVESTVGTPYDSTEADVVIQLDMPEDQGYVVRRLKVVKSRYHNQVYGWHPFRTVPLGPPQNLTPPIEGRRITPGAVGEPPRHGVVVYPSLHYVILRSGEEKGQPDGSLVPWGHEPGKLWGVEALNRVLPAGMRRGSVILVEGPRGAFKTNLAVTFLAQGLDCVDAGGQRTGESGLLIRLHDSPMLEVGPTGKRDWPALSADVDKDGRYWDSLSQVDDPRRVTPKGEHGEKRVGWHFIVDPKKAVISVWKHRVTKARLFELDFKSGALLPEELLQIVWDILIRQPKGREIRRVVLDDVSEIGAAYPFLCQSSTSGRSFLPAFAHVMRNNQIDTVVTGTTGDHPDGDEAVARVRAVSDAVLSCRYLSVFGRRHVIVPGEGLIARADESPDAAGSCVPPVMQNVREGGIPRRFRLNSRYLEGLVGFEKMDVHRPGVSLHLFQANGTPHERYNADIGTRLRAAFASGNDSGRSAAGEPSAAGNLSSGRDGASSVRVLAFGSRESEAIHDALSVFREDEPIRETVIATVDAFWDSVVGSESEGGSRKRFVRLDGMAGDMAEDPLVVEADKSAIPYVWPYYGNVLLLAYRRGVLDQGVSSWDKLASEVTNARLRSCCQDKECPPMSRRFWVDLSSPETLSCALLDAMVSDGKSTVPPPEPGFDQLYEIAVGTTGLPEPRKQTLLRELAALQRLFHASNWGSLGRAEQDEYRRVLPPDAMVYLCWYSQLRELIHREPRLANELKVCALPAGGFTGNWFIGVVKGSVSPALGQRVIEILCRRDEEYKRFAQGVGLPVHSAFRGQEFFAWPGTDSVTLDSILDICARRARSRSRIKGYSSIRSRLCNLASLLTPLAGPPPASDTSSARDYVAKVVANRVFAQVKMLRK